MERYYKITLINPFRRDFHLHDVITVLGTSDMIRDWSLGIIDIDKYIIPHYVQDYYEVDLLNITHIIEENISGLEKVIMYPDGREVKIILSFLEYDEISYVCNQETHTAVKIMNIKNLAKKSALGMEPLDKQDLYNFVVFKTHNKRKLIKRGVNYIHNHLIGNNIICDSFALLLQGLTPEKG